MEQSVSAPLQRAKQLLGGETSLAVVQNSEERTFTARGIGALLDLLPQEGIRGASVADKIVGKAAALLMVRGGVKEVYAETLSEGGDAVLRRYNVPHACGTLTPAIQNREGTGPCPMERAVENVNSILAPVVIGRDVFDQEGLDRALIEADGTRDKSNLGANAILGVSMAAAHAAAEAMKVRYLGGVRAKQMPVPMMNIINGGVHADNSLDIQEFMIVPAEKEGFREQLRVCAEVYHSLKSLLKDRGLHTSVGDEGGFAPDFKDTREALRTLRDAVEKAGYRMGRDIRIALDVAASELYDPDRKVYCFPGEGREKGEKVIRTTEEMTDYYLDLISEFPICSIEDPLDEEDWDGWSALTGKIGDRVQLVGDDLFTTNAERLEKGIRLGAANAVLIKVNQIGTLTEAFETMKLAQEAGYNTVISHRSGETEDTTIADIAVAFNAGQIKTGAPCRSERVAKYNRLLRIEEGLIKEGMKKTVN